MLKGNSDFNPFVIGIYHGFSKSDCSNDYLLNFVSEMESMELDGFVRGIAKQISGFCCDAPARAFISKTKSHTAYFCCSKCEAKGKWQGQLVLLNVNLKTRDDNSFH